MYVSSIQLFSFESKVPVEFHNVNVSSVLKSLLQVRGGVSQGGTSWIYVDLEVYVDINMKASAKKSWIVYISDLLFESCLPVCSDALVDAKNVKYRSILDRRRRPG